MALRLGVGHRANRLRFGPKHPEIGIDEFPDFDAARDDLIAHQCEPEIELVAAGECPGSLFLFDGTGGFVVQISFYDPSTRAFVSLITQTDCIDCLCGGQSYWPTLSDCSVGTVSEVICGTSVTVGDELEFGRFEFPCP